MQTKSALPAIALAALAFAGQAHADTIVRFPPKGGVPYTVQREEPRVVYTAPVRHAPAREAQRAHVKHVRKVTGNAVIR
ncbi:MAG: hypothetical protein JSR99_03415 [Proteobacteria bacterium]|nr:hypothetical protein [Pseudomonadota bacterium]